VEVAEMVMRRKLGQKWEKKMRGKMKEDICEERIFRRKETLELSQGSNLFYFGIFGLASKYILKVGFFWGGGV